MKIIWLAVLALILSASCSKSNNIDQVKYEPLYKAAKAVESSTSVGVSIYGFRELVQKFAAELSIAQDKADSEREKELIKSYRDVLEAYSCSLDFWRAQITPGEKWDEGPTCDGGPVSFISQRYNLLCLDYGGISFIPKESLQYLWTLGSETLKAANSLYLNRPKKINKSASDEFKNKLYLRVTTQIEKINARDIAARNEVWEKRKNAEE